MLPQITLTPEQQDAFKALKFVGDLAQQAGELSMAMLETEEADVGKALWLDKEVVRQALIGQNLLGIPEEQHRQFLQLAYKRQQYKRAIILYVIDNVNAFDFTPVEKAIIRSYLEFAHLFDELFDAWLQVVVQSELARKPSLIQLL